MVYAFATWVARVLSLTVQLQCLVSVTFAPLTDAKSVEKYVNSSVVLVVQRRRLAAETLCARAFQLRKCQVMQRFLFQSSVFFC